jgi:hypothetical protein
MSILDLQAEDLGLIFSEDEFAVPAVYTPKGGAAISLLAIFSAGPNLEDAQWRAALQATAIGYIRASDIVAITNRLDHGVVTNGPFVVGEMLTGDITGTGGEIETVGSGYVVVKSVSGTGFSAMETISVATKSSALSAVAVIETELNAGYQDTLSIDGVEWIVGQMTAKFGRLWKLELRSDLRPTFRR